MTSPLERDDMPSPQRRPDLPQNRDDRLKEFLAPSVYARLLTEAQQRNAAIAQVTRTLSTKRPK